MKKKKKRRKEEKKGEERGRDVKPTEVDSKAISFRLVLETSNIFPLISLALRDWYA